MRAPPLIGAATISIVVIRLELGTIGTISAGVQKIRYTTSPLSPTAQPGYPSQDITITQCEAGGCAPPQPATSFAFPPANGLDPGGTRLFVHTDALGSVRMLTDDTQNVVARYDYQPFGQDWQTTGVQAAANKIRFAGGERETDVVFGGWQALDYFGARYYQSQTGRFTRPDTPGIDQSLFDPQSWNLYTYVRNNPARHIDPTGQKCENGFNPETQAFCTEIIVEDPYRRAEEAWQAAQRFFLDSLFDYLLTPQVSNFAAGVGDALTGRMFPGVNTSLTEYARNRWGTDSIVAKSSMTYKAGNLTGANVGWVLAGSVSATAAAIANGKYGALFGRGKGTVFNSSDTVRFGWGWKGDALTGRDVIRLGIGPKGGTKWWNHIDFWYP